MKFFLVGCAFWSIAAFSIYAVRPNAALSRKTVETADRKSLFTAALVMLAVILLCTLPMGMNPLWNGEDPAHRNQYEVMTESVLDGRINLDYGDDMGPLLELENPYIWEARDGITYHWDHALYNGQYYMYFGIVPVFLLFLPFRIITGTTLLSYHATQVFTAFFIFGVFALFLLLSRKFFSKLAMSVYISLSAAVSIMSLWYIVGAPALYCTAISSGICMEIWSLFFFAKAVWDGDGERKSVCMGVLGSLFGALAFGCRPTVALANILAVPMFIRYIKGKPFNLKLCKQILAVLTPYIVIGSLLMIYNYVRFDDPFEFGQSYQLTFVDQRGFGNLLERFSLVTVINGLLENFIAYVPLEYSFPYISPQSLLLNFPICFVAAAALLQKDTLSALKKNKLTGLTGSLLFCPILITVFQVLEAPWLLERYRSDIYWIVGILIFLSFGHFLKTLSGRAERICGFIVSLLAFATIFRTFLLWTSPFDYNFTYVFPGSVDKFRSALCFGF